MLSANVLQLLVASSTASPAPASPGQLDRVMLFGFLSAVVTLICLVHVRQSRAFRLIFSLSLGAQAAYGFACGVWPMGLVAVVGSSLAAHWWWRDPAVLDPRMNLPRRPVHWGATSATELRVARLFDRGHGVDEN